MLGKLSIAGAVAAILMIPTLLSAQVGGAAVNPGAAVRGAVVRGIPTPGDSRVLLSDAPAASQWVWTLSYDYHEDRTPTHGNAATRDAALHAFARSWNMIRPTSSPWLAHQRPPVSQKEVRRSPTDLVEWLAG